MFCDTDKELQQNSAKFWQPYLPSNNTVLYQGPLFELSKNGELKERKYKLTDSFLLKSMIGSHKVKKMTNVNWKRIEPFIEENCVNSFYGFRVGYKDCYRDFYVDSQETLDIWLGHLAKVGIMPDIEDDFIFIREIGKGNYATVFLAESKEDYRKYAIKRIQKSRISAMTNGINSIVREIDIMRKLDHPNIVKLYNVYENDSEICLVLDYLEGGNLYERINQKKRFSEATIRTFAIRFFDVLSYLDSMHIVHRDIKLENIILTSKSNDFEFKLADFGIADYCKENLTLRCGSPGYIAPEILRKDVYNTKVDVFSAGVVLYILFCGKMPFFGTNVNEILLKNKECHIHFYDYEWRQASKEFISVILNVTEPAPRERLTAKQSLEFDWFSLDLPSRRSSHSSVHENPLNQNLAINEDQKPRCLSKGNKCSDIKGNAKI
ncbi:unnamed protein product [Blepharisma stoltei]|uniref:non-specific serine/threonine protein kinase n=1 Tax=Blepharisma stoltei TaxID=1481888 RepID=A0AAU9JPV9_9CILI|nr:unnamed protein product [Blepharisma stoltei]